jgi:hypothetical protein
MPFPLQRNKPDLDIVETTTSTTASQRFLFSNFRYYFTLFSKFFSSFPHGTCSLSVSHPYLALDGIYHPFELQSQTTRLMEGRPLHHSVDTNGAVTLRGVSFQTTLSTKIRGPYLLQTTSPKIFSLSFFRFTRRY